MTDFNVETMLNQDKMSENKTKMSFLKNIFGETNTENPIKKIDWLDLTDHNQLDAIVAQSAEKPIIIFKHSTRCSISRMALKQFENEFDLENKFTPYFLDLLEYRPISNEIATRFEVQHQSPQILVIKNGVCVHAASHENISPAVIEKFITQ